ncbi:hypothetical protein LINPERHAP1_LOCUS17575 [Linum perenne]
MNPIRTMMTFDLLIGVSVFDWPTAVNFPRFQSSCVPSKHYSSKCALIHEATVKPMKSSTPPSLAMATNHRRFGWARRGHPAVVSTSSGPEEHPHDLFQQSKCQNPCSGSGALPSYGT